MSIKIVGNLLSPLRYLYIKHEDKRMVDLWIPIFIAVIITVIFLNLPKPVAILGKEGFVAQVNGLLQMLTGFYIAALAAVSTFHAKGMDDVMLGVPPTIYELRGATYKLVRLTRRRFLCYLFGYLALVSFFAFILGLFANIVSTSVGRGESIPSWFSYLRAGSLFLYLFFLANMMTVTLLGLYYLTIKIHLNKPERQSLQNDDVGKPDSEKKEG